MGTYRMKAVLLAALFCGFGWIAQTEAQAETYPQRPVTLVVPFPAGSATDAVARKVAEGLQAELGQGFVVENKAGADGIVAARAVASAQPDGYTLFITTNTTHTANPSIYRELPYNPKTDFSPIGGIIKISYILAARPDLPADDFAGFIRLAKESKQPLSYGSGNTGGRASGEMLKSRLGFDMVNVPYRGTPQALTDLIGGRIDIFFPDPASALGMIAERKFKVFAVTGSKRVKTLPNVPTVAELGVPDFDISAWVAAFAPASTPAPIVTRLNEALNKVLHKPEMIAFIDQIGSDPFPTSPSELAAFVEQDAKRWVEIVEVAKIERK